jgi:hypothetical protein
VYIRNKSETPVSYWLKLVNSYVAEPQRATLLVMKSVFTRSPEIIPYARYTPHLRLSLYLFLSLVGVGFTTGLRPTFCRYTDYDTCWKVWGSNPGTQKIVFFSKTHIPALKPIQSPAVHCTRLAIERTRPDVDHWPQSSTKVKNEWSNRPPSVPSWSGQG